MLKTLASLSIAVLLLALHLHGSPLGDAADDLWEEQATTLAAMKEGVTAQAGAAECAMIMFGNAMLPKRACTKGNTGSCVTTVLPSKTGGDDMIVSNCDESGACTGMGGLIAPIADGGCITQPGTNQRIYCSKEQPADGKIPTNVKCVAVTPAGGSSSHDAAGGYSNEKVEGYGDDDDATKEASEKAGASAAERDAKAKTSEIADKAKAREQQQQDEKEVKSVKERSAKFKAKLKNQEGTQKIAKEVATKKMAKSSSSHIHVNPDQHAGASQLGLSAVCLLVPALAALW